MSAFPWHNYGSNVSGRPNSIGTEIAVKHNDMSFSVHLRPKHILFHDNFSNRCAFQFKSISVTSHCEPCALLIHSSHRLRNLVMIRFIFEQYQTFFHSNWFLNAVFLVLKCIWFRQRRETGDHSVSVFEQNTSEYHIRMRMIAFCSVRSGNHITVEWESEIVVGKTMMMVILKRKKTGFQPLSISVAFENECGLSYKRLSDLSLSWD